MKKAFKELCRESTSDKRVNLDQHRRAPNPKYVKVEDKFPFPKGLFFNLSEVDSRHLVF